MQGHYLLQYSAPREKGLEQFTVSTGTMASTAVMGVNQSQDSVFIEFK